MVVGADEFETNKSNIEGHFFEGVQRCSPTFAARMRGAKRKVGSGWVLVEDAGYTKGFITAQGISDAFRAAEWCVDALVVGRQARRN